MSKETTSGKQSILTELIDVILENLPINLPEKTRREVIAIIHRFFDPIMEEIEQARLPRIAVVGRRGAGKSSLLNALFEQKVAEVSAVKVGTVEPKWSTLKGQNNEDLVEILDTRGVQEGQRPENAPAITSLQSVLAAIRERTPDMFLFIVQAKAVNSAVEKDLEAMAECLRACRLKENGKELYPIVMGVVSQCDELDQTGFWSTKDRLFYSAYWDSEDLSAAQSDDDTDHEYKVEKLRNIHQAVADWRHYLSKIPGIDKAGHFKVIPVAAKLRFRADNTLDTDSRVDLRWNIEELKRLMLSELPPAAKMEFYRKAKLRAEQRGFAKKVIVATGLAATAIGAIPLLGADLPLLLGVQILQIMLIAFISGQPLSWKIASEFLAACGLQTGVGYLLREGFRQALKLIPIAGWILAGGIAGTSSAASGILAVKYFIDGQPITEADKRDAARDAGDYGQSA